MTSKTPRTDALIASLTIEQAEEYARQTDKLLWIETTLLDPNNIGRGMVHRVEEALIALLSDKR